jgi:hypothetical protein
MSTQYKKLYSRADIQDAEKDSNRVKEHFARKSAKRHTVQVRVGKEWHSRLKELAKSEKLVMSFLLDEVCKHFFKNY